MISMRLRHLRIRITTDRGPYGADLAFPDGLVVIRAENSMGKSTCIAAIMVALGLEDLISNSRQDLPLPPVMRTDLQAESGDARVLESDIYLEIESPRRGQIIVVHRTVRGSRDKNLISVTLGPALSEGAPASYPSKDYFVSRSGAASRELGFHRFLADFLGWDLPRVHTYEEQERRLYVQYVFPYLIVNQKRGWSSLTPPVPNHFRVRDPHKRAVEFLLDLDARRIAADRAQVRELEAQVQSAWTSAIASVEAVARSAGVMVQRLPERPRGSWPPELPPHMSVPLGSDWISLQKALESDERRLQGLVEDEIPRVDEITEKTASDLVKEQEALSYAESTLARLLTELEMERSEVRATQQRITRVEEDLQRNKDVKTLLQLGSQSASRLVEGACPTCHQDIEDSLVPLAEGQQTMSIDSNISFLEDQRAAFLGALQNAESIVAARERQIAARREAIGEMRANVRALRRTLVADGRTPSRVAIREQVVLEERTDHLRRTSEALDEQLLQLEELSDRWREVQARKKALPKLDVSEDDRTKVSDWAVALVDQLRVYEFQSVDPKTLTISPENYKASHEGFDLPSDVSASDFIRVIWAYLLGLLEVARSHGTNHPGMLVFDEPKQQSTKDLSFKELLARSSRAGDFGEQVIFATSEPEDSLREMLDGVPHRLLSFRGHIIRSLPQ